MIEKKNGPADGDIGKNIDASQEDDEIRIEDKRHWAVDDADSDGADDADEAPRQPTVIDEFRSRTETAEAKLQEYIEAFKSFRDEQEQVRARLNRDVERKVQLMFSELIASLLESVDDLDLALSHARQTPEAEALAQGVSMARTRFIRALEQAGVQKIELDGEEFDPNEAEALRVDPVESDAQNGKVTETLRPGYRYGDQVIRPAQVAVGRHTTP